MPNNNVIELLLKSVDQMTGDLRKVEAGLGRLQGTTENLGSQAEETGKGVEYLNTAMTTLGAVTGTVNPELKRLISAISLFQKALPVAAVGAMIAALFGLAKSTAEVGTEFLRLERITGISLENLSALKVIAEQNESSFGELSIALRTFNRVIGSAVTQGGELRESLHKLGIQEEQINSFYFDSEAALEAVAKKISALSSTVEKNRLAVQFFGRSGRDVLLLLDEIANKGLEGARKKAEALGLLMGRDLANQSKLFNDNLTALSQSLDQLKFALGTPLITAANNFLAILERIVTLGQSGRIKFIIPKADERSLPELQHDRSEIEEAMAKAIAEGMGKGGEEGMKEILEQVKKAETKEAFVALIKDLKIPPSVKAKLSADFNKLLDTRVKAAGGEAELENAELKRIKEAKEQADKIMTEMGQQLIKQVAQINSEITKTIASAQIALANEALAKSGDVEKFLKDTRVQLEKIRAAGREQIDRQHEEEVGRAGQKPADIARAARLRQQDEQINAQAQALEKTARDMRDRVLEGLKKAQVDAIGVAIDAREALIADQKKVIELGLSEAKTMDDILQKSQELAQSSQQLGEMRLAGIEQRILLLREEIDTQEMTKDKAADIVNQIMKLNVEAQKVRTAMRDIGAEAVAMQKQFADTKLLPAIEAEATRARAALTIWQEALQDLRDDAEIAGLADSRVQVSWNKILEITRQIDAVQQKILEKEIARQKIAVDNARFALEQKKGTQEQLDLEIAKLEEAQLRAKLAMGKGEKQALRDFAMEADRVASGMAKNFVDRFVQGLRDGKADFMAIFNEIGETIASDLLQEVVKGAIKPQITQMLAEGRKPADTLGGQLLDNIKYGIEDIFGVKLGGQPEKKEDPVVAAHQAVTELQMKNSETEKQNIIEGASAGAAELKQAADHLKGSASALEVAAEKLGSSGGGGGARPSGGGTDWDYVGKQEMRIQKLTEEIIQLKTAPAVGSATKTRQGSIYDMDSNEAGFEVLHEQLKPGAENLERSTRELKKGGSDLEIMAKKGQETFSALLTGIGTMAAGIAMIAGGGSTFQKVGGGLTAAAGLLGTLMKVVPLFGGAAPAAARGAIFTQAGPLPAFARGGMIGQMGLNSIPIQKLKTGRTIGGPIAGVFGEEGSELVARIKPNKGGDDKTSEPIIQNVYLVDQRRPNLGPRDIELVVEDSARRGGPVSKGIQNVIKRSRG